MTEREAAQTALDGLRARVVAGERIAPPDEAICYVYTISDTGGVVLYVGAGSGNRDRCSRRTTLSMRALADAGLLRAPERVASGLTEGEACALEIELIAKYGRTCDGGTLLNRSTGGAAAGAGVNFSTEHRAKLGSIWRGRKHSPETRAKIAAAATGRKMSPESIEKSRAANLGRKLSAEHRAKIGAGNVWRGRTHTAEARAKLRAVNIGKTLSAEAIAKRTASRRANRVRRAAEADMNAQHLKRWAPTR
jgi:NUMOD3 motif